MKFVWRRLARLGAFLMDTRIVERGFVLLGRVSAQLVGGTISQRILVKVVNLLSLPMHKLGVLTNIHAHGLLMRVESGLRKNRPAAKKAPVSPVPRRIGLVGELVDFKMAYLKVPHLPPENIHYFDLALNGDYSPYAFPAQSTVHQYDLGVLRSEVMIPVRDAAYEAELQRLAWDINEADLDLLLMGMNSMSQKQELAQLLTVPCIIDYPSGAVPVVHENLDYSLWTRKDALFYPKDGGLHSQFTGRNLPMVNCLEFDVLYHPLPVERSDFGAIGEKEHLVVWHGRLIKLRFRCFLDGVIQLLRNEPGLRFAFLGTGDGAEEALEYFRFHGLVDRVEYAGEVEYDKWVPGFMDGIFHFLNRAKLYLDSWPRGGGKSLLEAYTAGVPVVGMEMPTPGRDIDCEPEVLNHVLVPSTITREATARSMPEFLSLCGKCLHDPAFASDIVRGQREVLNRITDSRAWWDAIWDSYGHWFHGTGWAAGADPAANRRKAREA